MANRLTNPGSQHYSQTGEPLSGGKLYFYVPGTTTPKDTYSTITLDVPNENPVILSSGGLEPNIFLDGGYRVVLQASNGVQQWDRDNVNANPDVPFSDWLPTVSYGIEGVNIVYASDGNYYVSIDTPNIGNDPTSSPLFWTSFADYIAQAQVFVPAGEVAIGGDPDGLVGLDVTAKGSLLTGNGTDSIAFPVGANTLVLGANSAMASGLEWVTLPNSVHDVQEFSSSGTWNKPASSSFIYLEAWSGGGGGPNATASNALLGGGSSGEYISCLFRAVDLTSTVAVTIGSGGTGGANGGNNDGSVGGNTTFGAYATAVGGNPGIYDGGGSATIVGSVPRAADPSVSASTSIPRSVALPNASYGNTPTGGPSGSFNGGGGGGSSAGAGATGGTSVRAGNGGPGNNTLNTAAGNGSLPSGGGGASGNNGGGGNGGNGFVRVWSW